MALKRTPSAVTVNGVAFLIKDPDAESTDLFGKYRRVPGLASFTLPDETGSSNEVQLQDGTVATAQAAGVGQITGTVGALTPHPTHRLLSKKAKEGGNITVAIVRPAVEVLGEKTAAGAGITATTGGLVTATGTAKDDFKNLLSEGMLLAIGQTLSTSVIDYDGTPASANLGHYRVVVSVNEDGGKVQLGVGFSTAPSASGNKYRIVRGGQMFKDISCTVSGFGDGDYQSGGVVQSSITLQPVSAMPVPGIEGSTLADFSSTAYDGAFEDLS